MSLYRRDTGTSGEDAAALFLSAEGFDIIARNFRYKKAGEIDIVARKGNLLLFVEVKKRQSGYFGGALYSISPAKKQAIRFVANQFLFLNPQYNSTDFICRFDMIAIEDDEINWIEDCFRQ